MPNFNTMLRIQIQVLIFSEQVLLYNKLYPQIRIFFSNKVFLKNKILQGMQKDSRIREDYLNTETQPTRWVGNVLHEEYLNTEFSKYFSTYVESIFFKLKNQFLIIYILNICFPFPQLLLDLPHLSTNPASYSLSK